MSKIARSPDAAQISSRRADEFGVGIASGVGLTLDVAITVLQSGKRRPCPCFTSFLFLCFVAFPYALATPPLRTLRFAPARG